MGWPAEEVKGRLAEAGIAPMPGEDLKHLARRYATSPQKLFEIMQPPGYVPKAKGSGMGRGRETGD